MQKYNMPPMQPSTQRNGLKPKHFFAICIIIFILWKLFSNETNPESKQPNKKEILSTISHDFTLTKERKEQPIVYENQAIKVSSNNSRQIDSPTLQENQQLTITPQSVNAYEEVFPGVNAFDWFYKSKGNHDDVKNNPNAVKVLNFIFRLSPGYRTKLIDFKKNTEITFNTDLISKLRLKINPLKEGQYIFQNQKIIESLQPPEFDQNNVFCLLDISVDLQRNEEKWIVKLFVKDVVPVINTYQNYTGIKIVTEPDRLENPDIYISSFSCFVPKKRDEDLKYKNIEFLHTLYSLGVDGNYGEIDVSSLKKSSQ